MKDNHDNQLTVQYDALLDAVGAMAFTMESIQKDHDVMTGFSHYLSRNESEISKFGKATEEVCNYLDHYDFARAFYFDPMQQQLEALHPLRLKLVKMGEEAKKLSAFPDRYDSKRAIEICRGLAMTCLERMTLAETKKVEALVETNTKKLIDIQNLFDKERGVLSQINAAIEAENKVLGKFRAYLAELKQYVSGFPHQGVDDLAVVLKRLDVAKQVNNLWMNVDKAVESVRDYDNRHNKQAVMDNYSRLVADLSSKMCYADVTEFRSRLDEVSRQVIGVRNAFISEHDALQVLQRDLMNRKPDLWKEDNERLLSEVSTWLGKDLNHVSFDYDAIAARFVKAKQKRIDDVDAMLRKHRWLGSSRRYKPFHDALKTQYITYTEYQAAVEMIRKERRKRLLCIPIIGWIILLVNG